jgi:hypothetical protein
MDETVITFKPTARNEPDSIDSLVTSAARDTSLDTVTTLRGARVEVDVRRVSRVVLGVCLLCLAVLAVALFVAGADKNAQITELREHGVPVEVTVSKCLGLLGGSGSNEAGYACKGTFTIDGHHFNEAIPGDTFLPPGSSLKAVAAPGDSGLFSTASDVASEHASLRVFIVPTILVVVLALLVGALALKNRSTDSVAARGLEARR